MKTRISRSPAGKRLVLGLEDGRRSTNAARVRRQWVHDLRVEFVAGEPERMTQAEKSVLAARGLTGMRLSCQIVCDHDMSVRIISRLAGSGRARRRVSGQPTTIQPQPVEWTAK